MKPTLRQLEYLVAIADTGTFSAAAKRTFVSQPSLSTQVKDMEAVLGSSLFERGRRGALLTPIGEQLAVRARIILAEVEAMHTLARQSTRRMSGKIKLGVVSSVGPYLLPAAAGRLHTEYPDLRLFVKEAKAAELQTQLLEGHFDVIISVTALSPQTTSMPLTTEQLYISTAHDDALAGTRAAISLYDLKDRELLSLGPGHTLTDMVKDLALEAGATISDEYEGTSLDALRQMAAMGDWIAIIPSLYAVSEALKDKNLTVRPIDHPLASREISLTWRASSPLSETFEALGAVFQDVAGEILGV